MSWVLDSGSIAIVLMGAVIVLVRARYFCRYGKEALVVSGIHVMGLGLIRLFGTHDFVIVRSGIVNSWWSLACLGVQGVVVLQAEWTLQRERRGAARRE